MNNIETITILDNNKEVNIYILLEINKNNKNYVLYTKNLNLPIIKENIFVGEIIENKLMPIPNQMLVDFDKWIDIIIKNIKEISK